MSLVDEHGRKILSEEEVAANRIQWIEEQVSDIRRGFIDKIRCPYCNALNKVDTEMCCDKFKTACAAVLFREDQQDRADLAAEIADKVN